MKIRPLIRTAVFVPALLGITTLAAACPSCKETVGSQGDTVTRAWAHSIYLLMSVPYLLFAGLTFSIVRSARKNRQRGQAPTGSKGV